MLKSLLMYDWLTNAASQRSTGQGSSGFVKGFVQWITGLVAQKKAQERQQNESTRDKNTGTFARNRQRGKETGLKCTEEGWSHTGERC